MPFYKNHDNHQYYSGKWWITANIIHSQWPTYQKKSSANQIKYYHIQDNAYIPYNLNEACGPKDRFAMPFLVVSGDILKQNNRGQAPFVSFLKQTVPDPE